MINSLASNLYLDNGLIPALKPFGKLEVLQEILVIFTILVLSLKVDKKALLCKGASMACLQIGIGMLKTAAARSMLFTFTKAKGLIRECHVSGQMTW